MTMGPADIERKLRQHDNEIIAIYTKLDEIKATVKQHDRRFDQMDRRCDQVDTRFDQLAEQVGPSWTFSVTGARHHAEPRMSRSCPS